MSLRRGKERKYTTSNNSAAGSDCLADYYSSNEDIVRNDPLIGMILFFLQTKLFSDGINFMRGTERLIAPDDFQTHVQHYYMPFMYKAIEFMLARGYLVFTIYTNEKDVEVPDVPDMELLSIFIKYDEATWYPVVEACWQDSNDTRDLYVFNSQNPFGVTPFNTKAPVDRVKPFLRQWYQMIENRQVSAYFNSRPPMVLQHPPSTTRQTNQNRSDVNFDEDVEMVLQANMKTIGLDKLFIKRIQQLTDHDKQTFQNNKSATVKTWYERARERERDRPEGRFMYVPHGLQFVNTPLAAMDEHFVANQSALLENIFNSFGIPYSAILTSASKTSSTGIDLHRTMLLNTLKTWTSIFNILLTDIYRITFNVNNGTTAITNQNKAKRKKSVIKSQAAHAKKFGHHESGDEEDEEFDDSTLFQEEKEKLVTVHLGASNMTTPEIASDLFNQGVINWDNFKSLKLQSVGLPLSMLDTESKEPLRQEAQTMEEMLKLKETSTMQMAGKKH